MPVLQWLLAIYALKCAKGITHPVHSVRACSKTARSKASCWLAVAARNDGRSSHAVRLAMSGSKPGSQTMDCCEATTDEDCKSRFSRKSDVAMAGYGRLSVGMAWASGDM